MDEARAVLRRLGRIEALEREGAPPRSVLAEVHALLGKRKRGWPGAGPGRRRGSGLERCRDALCLPGRCEDAVVGMMKRVRSSRATGRRSRSIGGCCDGLVFRRPFAGRACGGWACRAARHVGHHVRRLRSSRSPRFSVRRRRGSRDRGRGAAQRSLRRSRSRSRRSSAAPLRRLLESQLIDESGAAPRRRTLRQAHPARGRPSTSRG